MKRWIILLLTLAFLLSAFGCTQNAPAPQKPVTFYYPADNTVYDGEATILHRETRESAGYEEDMAGLLSLYLKGPTSESLRSPFPRRVSVIRFATTSNTATLELSSEFARLNGIDLTVACACIANTLFDLTQMERVQIFAADSQLDGQASIVLDRDDIYYTDAPVVTDETPENTDASVQ